MKKGTKQENSFKDFKDSFSYGKRNDLNFKFLSHLNDKQAADFLEGLLKRIGGALDDGGWDRIVDHLIEGQTLGYSGPSNFPYESGPFTHPARPVSSSTAALLTSSGHFAAGDDPNPFGIENMPQEEAVTRIDDFLKEEPVLSEIPMSTPKDKLRVRHGGYDVEGAMADHNVVFPLDPLRVLARKGAVGKLSETAYSFVGACSQIRLRKRTGPQWVSMIREQAVDVLLLVPV